MKRLIDTSVAVKWAVREDDSDLAFRYYGPDAAIPDVLLPELANSLWKKVRTGEATRDQALAAYADICSNIQVLSTRGLEQRALEISLELNHPSYDCFFLALAEAGKTVLVTADLRLIRACDKTPFARLVEALA